MDIWAFDSTQINADSKRSQKKFKYIFLIARSLLYRYQNRIGIYVLAVYQ